MAYSSQDQAYSPLAASLSTFSDPTLAYGSAIDGLSAPSPWGLGGSGMSMGNPAVPASSGIGMPPLRPDDLTTNSEGGFFQNVNWGNLSDVLGGIGQLGKVVAAFQTNDIARKSAAFQEKAFEENLANKISSFNMALEDRAHSRAAQNGTGATGAQEYINRHRLGG